MGQATTLVAEEMTPMVQVGGHHASYNPSVNSHTL